MPLLLRTVQHLSPPIHPPLPTDLPSLNQSLRGGIPLASLTEIYGASATGKTCFHLSIVASAIIAGHSAIILDTEGAAISLRISQLISSRLPNATPQQLSEALSRVIVIRITSFQTLSVLPHALPEYLDRLCNVRIVCLDSIAALYRTCDVNAAPKRLEAFAQRMQELAVRYRMAVLLVNHGKEHEGIVVSGMGDSWTHVCSTRMAVRRTLRGFTLDVVKSAMCGGVEIRFQIEYGGLLEIEE